MLGSRATRARGSLVLAGVLALGVTAGCSGDDPKVAGPTQPAGPTPLSFAVYGPPQVVTAYATIAANYSAENPAAPVNVRPYPNSAAAQAALATEVKNGRQPDLFLAPAQAVPSMVQDGTVREVGSLLGEREVDFGDGFQRYSLEAFSFDNALQCMPVDVSPMVVYYNTELVDLATLNGPDAEPVTAETGWSLDEFALAARKAEGRGVRGVYVDPSIEALAPFIFSGGGRVVDDTNEPTTLELSEDSTQSALERLLELLRDPAATFNENQITQVPALKRFKNGSLAMMLGYRDLTPELREREDLSFDVMPIPDLGSKATTGRSAGLCLSAASEHVELAADFLAYAVSVDSSTLLAQTGFTVPTNVDVLNSEAFLQPDQLPVSASIFDRDVQIIQDLPAVPAWAAVERSAVPGLTRLLYDPVIAPLDDRLTLIDEASVPLFTPPTPTATPTS